MAKNRPALLIIEASLKSKISALVKGARMARENGDACSPGGEMNIVGVRLGAAYDAAAAELLDHLVLARKELGHG